MEGDFKSASVESVAAQSPCQLPQNVLTERINLAQFAFCGFLGSLDLVHFQS
jgi:hypothetical protein